MTKLNLKILMKILTLRNFILLMIIVIILHQVMSHTSVPIMIPMENIDTMLYAIHQRDVPSYINMDFTTRQALMPPTHQNSVPQTNYLLFAVSMYVLFGGSVISVTMLMSTIDVETPHVFVTFVSSLCGYFLGILGFLWIIQMF